MPRIISPSRYMEVTQAAIKAPRPGRFSSTCPPPGMIQANTTAASQGAEACGVLEGVVTGGTVAGVGVTGKLAPGLSLTESFYRIGLTWSDGPSKFHAHTYVRAAGGRHGERAAGVSVQELQLLVVNFYGVLGSWGQSQHEQGLIARVLHAELRGVRSGRTGDRRGSDLDRLDRRALAQGLKPAVLEELQASLKIADPGGVLIPTGAGEHLPGVGFVKHQRHLVVVQTGLIGVGPQKFVDGAEAAAHHKAVSHQPALQQLAIERVGIVSHHRQAL